MSSNTKQNKQRQYLQTVKHAANRVIIAIVFECHCPNPLSTSAHRGQTSSNSPTCSDASVRFQQRGHLAPVCATSFIDDTSYLAFTSSGSASIRTKWVGTMTVVSVRYRSIAAIVASASNLARITDGTPAHSRRIPDNGPVWYDHVSIEPGKQCVVGCSLHVSFRETVDMEVDSLPRKSFCFEHPIFHLFGCLAPKDG